jgi:hypothetical protein
MVEIKTKQILLEPNPNEIVDIPVGQLLLDSKNARLAWMVEGDKQEDLVRILWTEMAVDEVAWSIAENGFFRSEPLFVLVGNPEEKDESKREYVVVEGNRRLAAVLLLRDEKLRQKVGATTLPEIGARRREELEKLPAIIYPSRESLWTSVGFRHINGIKPWDSFSKAKYVAEVHEEYNVPLEEIADKIGDRHVTAKRLYRGYKILQQAEMQGVFDREDRARNRFYFSHLYTAVDQKDFQDFLGIDPEGSLKSNPVPESRVAELGELMTWLYGNKSEGVEPVVQTQNPDLNTLRKVISKPEALSILRTRRRLDLAYDVAIGDRQRFRNALTNAKVELQTAKSTVTTGYHGEPDPYEIMCEIMLYAETIEEEMRRVGGFESPNEVRAHRIGSRRR